MPHILGIQHGSSRKSSQSSSHEGYRLPGLHIHCGSCFAIAQVVKHSNSQSVGQLFSIAGAIALALAALSYFIERRQQAMAAQFANSVTLFTAMLLSMLLEEELAAAVLFVTVKATIDTLILYSWSSAAALTSPSFSKYLFPKLGFSGQVGIFLGSSLSILALLGIEDWIYRVSLLLASGVHLLSSIKLLFAKAYPLPQLTEKTEQLDARKFAKGTCF